MCIRFLAGVMVGSLSVCFGAYLDRADFKCQAVKHHAARYHPQTGKFEWIEKDSACNETAK